MMDIELYDEIAKDGEVVLRARTRSVWQVRTHLVREGVFCFGDFGSALGRQLRIVLF